MSEKKLDKKFLEIFSASSKNTGCHPKYETALNNLYKSMDFEEFLEQFMMGLHMSFGYPLESNHSSINNFLKFMSSFLVTVATNHEYRMAQEDLSVDDRTSHPLFKRVIGELAKYSDLDQIEPRYYSCHFTSLLLTQGNENFQLDDDICDDIERFMLPRLKDHKSIIRKEAILALFRLQDPGSPDCNVMKAFLPRFNDPVAAVRKEIVANIGLNSTTAAKIIGRTRDINSSVRAAAFLRCSRFNPKFIVIWGRQQVLATGFGESDPAVKKVFLDKMLPSWFSLYDGNILKFLHDIKLDSDETETKMSIKLFEKVLDVYFKTKPIGEIIDLLDLDDEKLIRQDKITSEHVTYWYLLIVYVQKHEEEMGEYFKAIFPELTQFCAYIESLIKSKSQQTLEHWEEIEYGQIVHTLFKIAHLCDFADEVGRQTLINLIKYILLNYKFEQQALIQIITVFGSVLGNTLEVCKEVCEIIREIRETKPDDPVKNPNQKNAENEYKKSRLRLELLTLEDEIENAIGGQQWQLAQDLHGRMAEIKATFETFQEEPERQGVNEMSDPVVIVRCIDILIALLSYPKLIKCNAPLRDIGVNFVEQVTNKEPEVLLKLFQCHVLYSLLDRKIAEDHLNLIIAPILLYKEQAVVTSFLLLAVKGVTDIVQVFGPSIVPVDNTSKSSGSKMGNSRYQNENSFESIFETVLDAMVDMLDDETDEITELAGTALAKLVAVKKITISSSLISRLLIKWFNPLTGKTNPKLIQILTEAIHHLFRQRNDRGEIFQQAIIQTVKTIANAPKNHPLADVNHNSTIQVLATLISRDRPDKTPDTHMNFTNAICCKLSDIPGNKFSNLLTKLLLELEIPYDDPLGVRELQNKLEVLVQDFKDKNVLRNIVKYQKKLNSLSCKGVTKEGADVIHPTEALETCNQINTMNTPAATNEIERGSVIDGLSLVEEDVTDADLINTVISLENEENWKTENFKSNEGQKQHLENTGRFHSDYLSSVGGFSSYCDEILDSELSPMRGSLVNKRHVATSTPFHPSEIKSKESASKESASKESASKDSSFRSSNSNESELSGMGEKEPNMLEIERISDQKIDNIVTKEDKKRSRGRSKYGSDTSSSSEELWPKKKTQKM